MLRYSLVSTAPPLIGYALMSLPPAATPIRPMQYKQMLPFLAMMCAMLFPLPSAPTDLTQLPSQKFRQASPLHENKTKKNRRVIGRRREATHRQRQRKMNQGPDPGTSLHSPRAERSRRCRDHLPAPGDCQGGVEGNPPRLAVLLQALRSALGGRPRRARGCPSARSTVPSARLVVLGMTINRKSGFSGVIRSR